MSMDSKVRMTSACHCWLCKWKELRAKDSAHTKVGMALSCQPRKIIKNLKSIGPTKK